VTGSFRASLYGERNERRGENRMIKKDDMPICEAANYFKEEILEIMPDISKAQLADMVSLYIYYQYGITREEAKKVIEKTCL
jgi:hypothetical protein